jgi:hypothetical protein
VQVTYGYEIDDASEQYWSVALANFASMGV